MHNNRGLDADRRLSLPNPQPSHPLLHAFQNGGWPHGSDKATHRLLFVIIRRWSVVLPSVSCLISEMSWHTWWLLAELAGSSPVLFWGTASTSIFQPLSEWATLTTTAPARQLESPPTTPFLRNSDNLHTPSWSAKTGGCAGWTTHVHGSSESFGSQLSRTVFGVLVRSWCFLLWSAVVDRTKALKSAIVVPPCFPLLFSTLFFCLPFLITSSKPPPSAIVGVTFLLIIIHGCYGGSRPGSGSLSADYNRFHTRYPSKSTVLQ